MYGGKFFLKNEESKTVAAYTLGCKVNQYDSDAVVEKFIKDGYTLVDFSESADVYLVNTCTVTHLSDRKCRQMLRRTKKINPSSILIAMGCYAQIAKEKLQEEVPEIDIIVGTDNRNSIIDLIRLFKDNNIKNDITNIMDVEEYEELSISTTTSKTRAYLKIQEGCNNYCSYCIIPYVRGKIRSRKENNVLAEAIRLSKANFKEIVLTGIHVASYGKDLVDTNLISIIKKIAKIDGIQRIRLSSIEPTIIDDEFVDMLKTTPKICDHFHLSLQSGSDTVLKRMNRKYNTQTYLDSVKKLRSIMPNVGLTTDIIVGFPGETEEEFLSTLEFVDKIGFLDVHIFPYSKRDGTIAAKMDNQLDAHVKEVRAKKLKEVVNRNRNKFIKNMIGKEVEILFENNTQGFTSNYVRVDVESGGLLNNLVKINKLTYNMLEGSIVE
ncbi:MAG: tRNA (N(6)-L-threonylcarbamoyladenosine(37)-C(2))-methylthiotransferase MtaB [Candidatus Epulonipiscioides saccharophilum]|nr:MAG: tRNA (N(6)-L-threonylcarbamoyladenosine(37)-C(2))-methylthiotransferase MtaB [Epulopiscium sp. AS2M-Bin001]